MNPPLECFVFRHRPQRYSHFEFAGNTTVVGKVTAKTIKIVTCNVYHVMTLELSHEEFFTQYFVDPGVETRIAARLLRSYYTSTTKNLKPGDFETDSILSSIIEKALTEKDFKMKKVKTTAIVHIDDHRRTCIEIYRKNGDVHYIAVEYGESIEIHQEQEKDFDKRFKLLEEYPVEKAARLFVEYAKYLGATEPALNKLAQLCNLSKSEKEAIMATAKKSAKKTEAAKPTKKEPSKPAKPIVKKAPAVKKESGSAAQMFKDLIMAGKMTDDQIFKKVQEKFGLSDNKRSYVNWYRKHLEKQGAKPPKAKG